jgi:hypothetical protein
VKSSKSPVITQLKPQRSFVMSRNTFALWTAFLVSLSFFSTAAHAFKPAMVHVTSDNAYRFALGKQAGINGALNQYWFPGVWNNNTAQISAAESYPNITTLSYDHFYIACYGGYNRPTTKERYADVVFVIDESTSMKGEQQFTSHLVAKLEQLLVKHGIGAKGQLNRYGIVGFGGPPSWHPNNFSGKDHVLGHLHAGPLHYSDYSAEVNTLEAEGGGNTGGEDGWSGIKCALDKYPWRNGSERTIILVTDENRDEEEPGITGASLIASLKKHKVTLNAIVYCNIREPLKMVTVTNNGVSTTFPYSAPGMAIDSSGTVFSLAKGGNYTTSLNGSIQDDLGAWGTQYALGTVAEYADLAFATGGLAADIRIVDLYGTANYAQAAGDSLANAVSTSIIYSSNTKKKFYRGVIAEVVDGNFKHQFPFDLQAAKWEVYATGSQGNLNGIWSASNPPSIGNINVHILKANSVNGGPGTSTGWVDDQGWVHNGSGALQFQGGCGKLAIGEHNNSNGTGYFDIVSPMDSSTRWMWYNPPAPVTQPFVYGLASQGKNNGSSGLLIFRLRLRDLRPTRRSSDDPRPDDPRSDDPRSDDPRSDDPRSDDPRSDDPRSDDPRSDEPRPDEPRPDKPRSNSPRPVLVSPNSARSNSARSNSARSNSARSSSARSSSARSSSARSGSVRSGRSTIRRPVKLRPVDRRPRTVRPAASTSTTRTKSTDKDKKSPKPLEGKATSKNTVKKKARRAKGAKD